MTDSELAVMTHRVLNNMHRDGMSKDYLDDLKAMTDSGLLVDFSKRVIIEASLYAFGELLLRITGNLINSGYLSDSLNVHDYDIANKAIASAVMGIKIDHAD